MESDGGGRAKPSHPLRVVLFQICFCGKRCFIQKAQKRVVRCLRENPGRLLHHERGEGVPNDSENCGSAQMPAHPSLTCVQRVWGHVVGDAEVLRILVPIPTFSARQAMLSPRAERQPFRDRASWCQKRRGECRGAWRADDRSTSITVPKGPSHQRGER